MSKNYDSDLKRLATIKKMLDVCFADMRSASCAIGESEEIMQNRVLANKQLFKAHDHLRLAILNLDNALNNL